MAKYIVKQYVAAVGGEGALDGVESMYAIPTPTIPIREHVCLSYTQYTKLENICAYPTHHKQIGKNPNNFKKLGEDS